MKGFPTSADIYLELDGRKIAVVQSYRAKAAKSSKNIEAFGESEPVATIEGQKSYTVVDITNSLVDADIVLIIGAWTWQGAQTGFYQSSTVGTRWCCSRS